MIAAVSSTDTDAGTEVVDLSHPDAALPVSVMVGKYYVGQTCSGTPANDPVDAFIDVTFGNGLFVGVGLHGLRMSSEDGLAWSERLVGEEGEHINSVLWTGERFVAVGQGATDRVQEHEGVAAQPGSRVRWACR